MWLLKVRRPGRKKWHRWTYGKRVPYARDGQIRGKRMAIFLAGGAIAAGVEVKLEKTSQRGPGMSAGVVGGGDA